jgi:hypothetical protein
MKQERKVFSDHVQRQFQPKFEERKPYQYSPTVKLFLGPRKLFFSSSQYYMSECSSHRPGEVITADYIEGFNTNVRLFLSQIKYPTKKPSLITSS